jgi:hypothetical protein
MARGGVLTVVRASRIVGDLSKPVERDCVEQPDNRSHADKAEGDEEWDCCVHGRKSMLGDFLPIVAVWTVVDMFLPICAGHSN